MNKELEEMVEELWNKMPSNELDEEEVYFGYKNTLRKALTQAHQAGIDEAVEKIKEAVSTIKVETTPPYRPDETLEWQADLINKHIMPAVRERFLAEIEALQDNK